MDTKDIAYLLQRARGSSRPGVSVRMIGRSQGDKMLDHEHIRQHLIERLAELRAHVADIEADLQQPMDDDFAEQATDRADDEALDAVEQSALAEIEMITSALARIEAGTYGICASCGKLIAPRRLEVMPAALLCMECAR